MKCYEISTGTDNFSSCICISYLPWCDLKILCHSELLLILSIIIIQFSIKEQYFFAEQCPWYWLSRWMFLQKPHASTLSLNEFFRHFCSNLPCSVSNRAMKLSIESLFFFMSDIVDFPIPYSFANFLLDSPFFKNLYKIVFTFC